jgi:hypothetical protein
MSENCTKTYVTYGERTVSVRYQATVDDRYSIEVAATHVKIDPKTARRWLEELEENVQYLLLHYRTPMPGKIQIEDQAICT